MIKIHIHDFIPLTIEEVPNGAYFAMLRNRSVNPSIIGKVISTNYDQEQSTVIMTTLDLQAPSEEIMSFSCQVLPVQICDDCGQIHEADENYLDVGDWTCPDCALKKNHESTNAFSDILETQRILDQFHR